MRGQPSLTPYHMSPDTCPVEFPRRGHDHHVSQARARQPYEARQRGENKGIIPLEIIEGVRVCAVNVDRGRATRERRADQMPAGPWPGRSGDLELPG